MLRVGRPLSASRRPARRRHNRERPRLLSAAWLGVRREDRRVHQQPGKTGRLFSGSRYGRKSGDLLLAGWRLRVVGCFKIARHSHHPQPTTDNEQQIMKSAYELAMERLNK